MSRDRMEAIFLGWMLADESLASREDATSPFFHFRAVEERAIASAAHFLLLFGQFERCLDGAYLDRVGPPAEAALPHRAHVLFGTDDADLVHEWYELRCELAHGRATSWPVFDLATAFRPLSDLAARCSA